MRSGSRRGRGSLCGSEIAHRLTNLGDLFHIEVGSREFEQRSKQSVVGIADVEADVDVVDARESTTPEKAGVVKTDR